MVVSTQHHPSVSSSSIPAQLHREHFSSSELDLDAINAEDFDPVLFINKQFPSEKSLQGVEKTIQKLDAVAKNIDAEVTVAIREQAKLGFKAKEDLQEGKQAIFQLIERVKSVQSKAEQSESLVLEFCRNIKFLDLAKKNLTHTVTGFKRFVMLVSALEQLRRRAAERKYKEASQLLNACEELSLHFLELSKVVHKVHDLLRQKDALLADLRAQIFEDYDALLDPTEVEVRKKDIKAAAHCVNAMADHQAALQQAAKDHKDNAQAAAKDKDINIRDEIVTRFCLRLLEDYKNFFAPGGTSGSGMSLAGIIVAESSEPSDHPQQGGAGGSSSSAGSDYSALEHVERRYAWLRRTLKEFDDKYLEFFPSEWRVPCSLTEHFCHITRQHLVEVLGATHHKTDPELLVRVLRKSIDFENDMARKFAGGQSDEGELGGRGGQQRPVRHISELVAEDEEEKDAPSEQADADVPSAFTKYGYSPSKPKKGAESGSAGKHHPRFRGIVSECFECYLGTWLNYEAEKLKRLIPEEEEMPAETSSTTGAGDDDDDEDAEDSRYVFSSAVDLFDSMRRTLMKTVSFSIDQTLFEVFLVFKQTVGLYCATIEKRVSKFSTSTTSTDVELKLACACIGTLEYVDQMLPQLLDALKAHIKPAYHSRLDFDQEQEALGAITADIYSRVLVPSRLDGLLKTLAKTMMLEYRDRQKSLKNGSESGSLLSQSSLGTGVGATPGCSTSAFVQQMELVFKEHCNLCRAYLSELHYRFFADKHAQWFVPRFTAEVYKCRGISKRLAAYFLHDTVAIKTMLLQVPNAAGCGAGEQHQTSADEVSVVSGGGGGGASSSGGGKNNSSKNYKPLPNAYSNYVLRELARIEFIFRVLCEDEDAMQRLNHGVDVTQREIDQILLLKDNNLAEGVELEEEGVGLKLNSGADRGDLGGLGGAGARLNNLGQLTSTTAGDLGASATQGMKQLASDARKQADSMKQLAADARKKIFGGIKF